MVMDETSSALVPYFISEARFTTFLKDMDRGPLFATVAREAGRSSFERIATQSLERVTVRCLPAVEAAKSFLFPVKERVAVYPSGTAMPETGLSEEAPQILLGLRACDLAALEILDTVLREGDFEDPFYARRRELSVLISVDCLTPAETCFCNLVDGKPYAEDTGSDLNLTPISGGYIVDIGSQAGREIVIEQAHNFHEATPAQLREREQLRAASWQKLEQQNSDFKPKRPVQEVLAEGQPASGWLPFAAGCVECGGCSYVCPTCHCFLLYDQIMDRKHNQNERIKAWDSCIFGSFARMAGVGGVKPTPRPELPLRFENRIRHKFDWMPQNIGRLGCVGCGRCTEVCLGGRDIREVIREIGGQE